MSDLEYAPRGTDSVRLVGVHASDSLGLRGGAIGRLRGVDWTFGPGIHAVVGTVADGTAALASVLTGELRPEVGSCLVDGVSPFDSPASRRRIGALLPKPTPLAGSVEELALFCAGRAGWQALLERFDLGALASRQLATLALRDARAVELALAFGTVSPRLLVLFEPWSDVRGIDVMEFRELLLERQIEAEIRPRHHPVAPDICDEQPRQQPSGEGSERLLRGQQRLRLPTVTRNCRATVGTDANAVGP